MSRRKTNIWKFIHKQIGLVMTIFILLFCISGILLNHREAISDYSVSRSLLPESYSIKDYNNGIIKGTVALDNGSVVAYGCGGAWLTDKALSRFADFNDGLPAGVDNRNIRNIVKTRDGKLWCAAQFGLYRLTDSHKWQHVALPDNEDRLSDVALTADSSHIVVVTRSTVYTQTADGSFTPRQLKAPLGRDMKITLFKTVWQLHSGQLFGVVGTTIVDIIAIVIIFLCLTGIMLYVMPYSMRKSAASGVKRKARIFKWNFKWHNKTGFATIILTVMIAATGMCLRPPLMIPLVMIKTSPLPGSTLDNDNKWHDKLRAIRWDTARGKWLLSTSEGFITVDERFAEAPELLESRMTPPVSPMGVTVFEPTAPNQWLVGAFSGLFRWDSASGEVSDYHTNQKVCQKGGRPTGSDIVAGFSNDFNAPNIVFDYVKGSDSRLPQMPAVLTKLPMSLWNFALELHVGRCYTPFLGPISDLFVFLSGLTLTLVLVSGLILRNRRPNHLKDNNKTNK